MRIGFKDLLSGDADICWHGNALRVRSRAAGQVEAELAILDDASAFEESVNQHERNGQQTQESDGDWHGAVGLRRRPARHSADEGRQQQESKK